ncbi:BSD domain-containing protein 1 [Rhynchospora pubera]|uniref:BSD domain-containing protein 1 n=1 Tax=Rhynchospora pubera TaxID=906938 RepID=A0AAV8HK33_9POAL|nr:BSD domain-containing protein 1 [Rhynchospora pubera]
MDFFKSVFSPDLDPNHDQSSDEAASASSNPNTNPTGGGWNLGGLIKTVASKSESVIQTYRRDLEEFGSGLKKETAAIREVAARSVDEIIKHGKEVLAVDSNDDSSHNAAGKRYTRLEAQIMAIQSDEGTFTTDPEDMEDFENWKVGFDLEERKDEIEMLLYDSNVLESMSEQFIPDIVDYWTFWYRYFYRVLKVKQAEEARAELVKRVISRDDEEEELSWEVEDDEELEKTKGTHADKEPKDGEKKLEISSGETQVGKEKEDGERNRELDGIEKIEVTQLENVQKDGDVKRELNEVEKNEDILREKVEKDEKLDRESSGTAEAQDTETLKDLGSKHEENTRNASVEKDTSVPEPVPTKTAGVPSEVSSSTAAKDEKLNSKSAAEEDLEWDEIEDLGEGDDNKPSGSIANSSPKVKEDLRKRLSVAEDDEDLSWDIEEEDDDVPAKK